MMNNKERSLRSINNQYQKYLDAKKSVSCEKQWLQDYGYYLLKDKDNLYQWYGLVVGPDQSDYAGCLLLIRINFPTNDYPYSPPKIENLLSFPTQFNTNLWSANTVQSLMCSDGQYQSFYGLICMDILNTPHSKIEQKYGHAVEVYDKSAEQYTPCMGIHNILISLRSNILAGETRLPHITDFQLKYLTFRYLTGGVIDGEIKLKDTEKVYVSEQLSPILSEIKKVYQEHYQTTYQKLSTSDQLPEIEKIYLEQLHQRLQS